MMSLVPKIWAQKIEENLLSQLQYQLKFEHSWNFQCSKRVERVYKANRRRRGMHLLPRPALLYRPPLFPLRGEELHIGVIK